jgi:hypothetical protein
MLVACLERHSLAFTVVDEAAARRLSELAQANVDVVVKIDVGMERLGAAPRDGLGLVELVHALPRVSLAGIYTHMHIAAGAHVDAYIDWQVERFQSVLDEVTRAEIDIPLAVAASSPVLALRGGPAFGGVDAGHLLYGMQPSSSTTLYPHLRRVFKSLKTRLIQCKAVERDRFQANAPFPTRPGMRIGIIPIGRADGLQSLTYGLAPPDLVEVLGGLGQEVVVVTRGTGELQSLVQALQLLGNRTRPGEPGVLTSGRLAGRPAVVVATAVEALDVHADPDAQPLILIALVEDRPVNPVGVPIDVLWPGVVTAQRRAVDRRRTHPVDAGDVAEARIPGVRRAHLRRRQRSAIDEL